MRAPAFLTVQDLGFTGHRAEGMPVSGAMDRSALRSGNAIIGNAEGLAALEWSLTGGSIRFDRDTTIALTGARVSARLDDSPVSASTATAVPAGGTLTVDRFVSGRFLYLCVSGGIDTAPVLGSRSTYLPAAIGGHEGRRLRMGDVLPLGSAMKGTAAAPEYPAPPNDARVRVIPGPQFGMFGDGARILLTSAAFTISATSDRTGYHLEGARFPPNELGSILSEPACPGSIQVTPSGRAIVLMADGPTIGGYPKIAVVASADLHRVAQRMPGEEVRFDIESPPPSPIVA